MNWEALGAIGEIIGAAAVVASLVYLAIQIRSQNRESRLASTHQVIEGYRTSIAWLKDPDMASIFIDAIEDYDGLSVKQRLQFDMYLTNAFRSLEEAYLQYQSGRLDPEAWRAAMAPLRDTIATETFGKFWARRKHHFREDWASYVESLEPGNGDLWAPD
jgi:hypothetical protein